MSHRPLPTRDSLKRSDVTLQDIAPVAAAYVRGELMTREEWADLTNRFLETAAYLRGEGPLPTSIPPDSLRPDSHGSQETR